MSDVEIRILLIEGRAGEFKLLPGMLSGAAPGTRFMLETVSTLKEGMERTESKRFDVVLLDLNLPDGEGLEALRRFRDSVYDGPVIILSASNEEHLGVEAVRLGAQDYLVKGQVTVPLLTRSIFYAIERWRVEEELKRYRERLEEMVEQRTLELQTANRRLSVEIAERERAQGELAASEEKYRLLVDHAHEAITVEADTVIKFVNPAASELTGLPPERLGGRRFEEFLHPDDRDEILEVYRRRHLGEPVVAPKSFRVLRANGQTRWVELNTVEIKWEGRPASLNFLRDFTDQKMLEEQIVQAQKMDAIGRLAGGIAHDFNNLLMVISGYSEIVRGAVAPNDVTAGALDQIRKAVDRAATLTSQLLSFSRKQPIKPEVVDLNDVIRGAARMLQPLLRREVQLVLALSGGPKPIVADPAQIEQVLINLAANSRDAMPGGGDLRISTRDGASGRPGDWVVLAIEDTGTGMSKETVSHIFEPFFTTKKRGQGTGLGLATVYGIVRQFGGEILVESTPGAGTIFTILFPASAMPLTEPMMSGPGAPSQIGRGRILLVDDEPEVLNVLRRILEDAGYDVTTASRREEALSVVSTIEGSIRAALVDVVMPGMKIGEFVAALRRERPATRLILISGYSGSTEDVSEIAKRADLFLRKPIEGGALLREIGRVVGAS